MTAATALRSDRRPTFDVERVRVDFPGLAQEVHGKPLVYLDNAASSQTPKPVVDALVKAYLEDRANVHRGVHTLSQRATVAYEAVRGKTQAWVGAEHEDEIIFVRGATEAINLVAQTWGRANIGAGDLLLVSELEHHANIVPWQMLASEKGARIEVIPADDRGCLDLAAYRALLAHKPRLVAVGHVSNALGTLHPVQEMVALAHDAGAVVMVDVRELGADFYAFSSHKMYGPTGVGVLYGKRALLDAMPPWQGGGDMIEQVSFSGTTFAKGAAKFEAGTPDITAVIAFGACLDWLGSIDFDAGAAWEHHVLEHATALLEKIEGVRIVGTAPQKASVLSFAVEGVHPHDIGMLLDEEGVAVRTGHHCAQPAMARFGVTATSRASFALYNTEAEAEALALALEKALRILR